MTDDMRKAIQIVRKEFDEVRARIERGKGVWPDTDYVRDDIWDSWRGQMYVLQKILRKLEESND